MLFKVLTIKMDKINNDINTLNAKCEVLFKMLESIDTKNKEIYDKNLIASIPYYIEEILSKKYNEIITLRQFRKKYPKEWKILKEKISWKKTKYIYKFMKKNKSDVLKISFEDDIDFDYMKNIVKKCFYNNEINILIDTLKWLKFNE